MTVLPPDLLRRNLIGVLVVIAGLAAYYLTEIGPGVSDYRRETSVAPTAPAGGQVRADGLTWRLESIRRLPALRGPMARPLPAGTTAQIVTISRTGSGPDAGCDAVLADGTSRWRSEGLGSRSVLPPEGTTTDCSAPGPVQFTFIVPQGTDPTAVDVVDYGNRIIARLLV